VSADLLSQAQLARQSGNLRAAKRICQEVIEQNGKDVQATGLLASIESCLGDHRASLALFNRAIELNPHNPFLFNDRGCVLLELGREHDAFASFARAIELFPAYPESYGNMGLILLKLKKFEDAERVFRSAIAHDPGSAVFHSNLGMALRSLGRFDEALSCYKQSSLLCPMDAEPLYSQGVIFNLIGQVKEAVEAYKRAIFLNPNHKSSLNNLGILLTKARRYQEALNFFQRLEAVDPTFPELYSHLGNLQYLLGKGEDAVLSYLKASEYDTQSPLTLLNIGVFYIRQDKFKEASEILERLFSMAPDYPYVCGYLIHSQMQICQWARVDELSALIAHEARRESSPSHPFPPIAFMDEPGSYLLLTRRYVDTEFPNRSIPSIWQSKPQADVIRLAYFSADFRNHPVMQLMLDVFIHHNKSRFRVYAFAFHVDEKDPVQKRLRGYFHDFIDVGKLSDMEVAQRARDLGIDIAIDLMGFTRNSRTGIFAHRAAPIQINYLGYPGTMGASYMDYIIADKIVIPESHRQYYTEKVLYMPNCFQPNMRSRAVLGKLFTRRGVGLPDAGFVFCSFNNVYKITPMVFAAWMEILKQVEGSVLWIAVNNETAVENIKRSAQERGVDPNRVVIAPRVATVEEHLARLRLADLFLDTYPYNAHTTASDAIRMGLPLVSLQGQTFASRVATSVLVAVGLGELVTTTIEAYQSLAIELGQNPERLKAIKETLAKTAPGSSLFDSEQYTKDLESLYFQLCPMRQASTSDTDLLPLRDC